MAQQEHPMFVSSQPPGSPLEFTVEINTPHELELDTIIETWRTVEGVGQLAHFGVVDSISVGEYYRALVRVVRTHPSVYLPPMPGCQARISTLHNVNWALRFDGMDRKIVIGRMSNGMPAYANADFLSGVKGAHINIAGISGVATKTSYALFLLYSLFQNPAGQNSRAILFNVKGDDLLYLDRPNARLTAEDRKVYAELGLPCKPFENVTYHGGSRALWTLREFARLGLIRHAVASADQTDVLEFALDRVAESLRKAATVSEGPGLVVVSKLQGSRRCLNLGELVDFFQVEDDGEKSDWFENVVTGTRRALVRRLAGICPQIAGLIGEEGRYDPFEGQVNVVDIHSLTDRSKAFAIGSVLNTVHIARETMPDGFPTTYLMVDELNKYAPRERGGSVKEMLLDLAERGRSLGLVLVGAEQTASQVEERVVGNSALRVVGRVESAEANREIYGWLGESLRQRACMLQPGTMIVSQPEVPVPLVLSFPFPAWASRRSEVPGRGGVKRESRPEPPT